MRLFYKILKITAVFVIAVTVVLFSASFLLQDKVAGIILKSLNKSITTKFEFESVKLSFLRKFPEASLDLKNVLVHSSSDFDKNAFTGINTDTLLAAKSVFIEFSMADIYHGIYNIDRIGIREGTLKLLIDTAGKVNYEIAVETGKEKGNESDFTIILNKISVTDLKAYYNNLAVRLLIEGKMENGRLKSRISGDEIDFDASSAIQISNFQLYGTRIKNSISADININLHSSDSGTVFNKGSVRFENYLFSVRGSVSGNDLLDLSLNGENLDIRGIKKYLPEELLVKISDYDPAGLLRVSSSIRGLLTRTAYPEITLNFILKDGSVTLLDKALNINNVSLTGFFSNGSGHTPKTSLLTINNFTGSLGSSQYTGSLSLSDFDSLHGSLQLKGKVIPDELKDFFRIKAVSSSKGSADIDLKMNGAPGRLKKLTFPAILDMKPTASVSFNSLSIGFNNDRMLLDHINGRLILADSMRAENIHFGYKNHRFAVTGIFRKLPEWLAGKPVTLTGSASIKCDRLVPETLFTSRSEADSSSNAKKAFSLPADMALDLDFSVDTFMIKKFKAENISGSLSYKPGLVNFKTLKFNSLNGIVTGNCFIVQNPDKSFISKGSFDLENININSAFRSFNNFGQNFIKAENINGDLSGSLSLLLPADSLMKIDVKSMTAEGKYIILNGALVDFDPVRELSAFIELSELENISFEKLENDFFIRNNFLYIPQMDVKSSAADLSVNGRHSFDNDYEYHVKVLLSEMLSRKLRKPKPNTTEFGAVKDDGLGRTSVLLKIEDKGEDVKVSYDIRAAGNEIKNDIKKERQTLKTILNEEYGWFRNDTAKTQEPASKEPRFRITWEESDTTKAEEEKPLQETGKNPLKNLFKKKNN
jgi:AsmA-like C-terminal region